MDTKKIKAKLEYLLLISKDLGAIFWLLTKDLWTSWKALTSEEKQKYAGIMLGIFLFCAYVMSVLDTIHRRSVMPEPTTGGDWEQYAKEHEPEIWKSVPNILKDKEDRDN